MANFSKVLGKKLAVGVEVLKEFLTKHVKSLAVKLSICQVSKNRCCCELGQHKSVVNSSLKAFTATFKLM